MPQSGEDVPPFKAYYLLGPFAICSRIELPELRVLPEPSAMDAIGAAKLILVDVKVGDVPESVAAPAFRSEVCVASATELLLNIEGVARYYVRDGCEVIVASAPGGSLLEMRAFLLGNIFAVLCHQRRWLPLHASAIRMGGGVVAFLGNSGAGKSTLAGYLAKAGYPLVADDICLLDPGADADARVMPVAPWLKLWRRSLEVLGHGVEGLTQTYTDEDKFHVPMDGSVDALQRLPLKAVVILERRQGGDGGGVELTPMQPAQAIAGMMNFTYQGYLLTWLGLQGEQFEQCAKALADAQAFTCTREWTFDSLPLMLDGLRAQFE